MCEHGLEHVASRPAVRTLRMTWKSLLLAAIIAVASGTALPQAHAEEKSRDAAVEEWLNKYHDANSFYVIFPNGQIFTARAKWTGVFIGRLNLWHCLEYMPLRYQGDEDIYLRARVVQFVDDDARDVAARYKTQCALKSYPGDPYDHVVPRYAGR
jgi:hypothetical protein